MPNLDHTGPHGAGPRSGRGQGLCGRRHDAAPDETDAPPRHRGRRRGAATDEADTPLAHHGRGGGRGRGHGHGHGRGSKARGPVDDTFLDGTATDDPAERRARLEAELARLDACRRAVEAALRAIAPATGDAIGA